MREQAIDLGGAVVYWSLSEWTDRARLHDGFAAAGFAAHVPDARPLAAVLRDALKEGAGGPGVLVRPLRTRDGFAVVEERRGEAANAYRQTLAARVAADGALEFDPEDARALAYALDVPPSTDADDDPSRQHVHGFHTYPARLHPDTAGRLVRAFVPPGGRVLDPFCGSGTVLVESLVAGRRPVGTDLNPLAVRLAAVKTRPRTEVEVEHLIQRAHEVAGHADDRRKAKAGATRRFPIDDVELFEPHVLLELDSLRDGIETLPDEPARLDLLLVLSACLVKLSKKRGDTTDRVVGRRTAGGFPAPSSKARK